MVILFYFEKIEQRHGAAEKRRQYNESANSPQTVTATPVMFKGVSSSPKSKADALIVATSFAIPAIDIGTAPTRWIILKRMTITIRSTDANWCQNRHALVLGEDHGECNYSRKDKKSGSL